MNLAIWHPRKVQSATIYQVTDRSHDGRTARVPGDEHRVRLVVGVGHPKPVGR